MTAISLSLLILFTSLTGLQKSVSAYNGKQQQQQQQATYYSRTDISNKPQLMVAVYCGSSSASSKSLSLYHNQYLEIETKKWRTDHDASAYCTQDKQEILNYCRKVYKGHDISNIVESARPYKIENWCRLGSSKRRCRTRLTVRPYRCLEGQFQSDALLVPDKCWFDHVHNKSACASPDHWNKTVVEHCANKVTKPLSLGMLQPCGVDLFSGVEFVCCPSSAQLPADSKKVDVPAAQAVASDIGTLTQIGNKIVSRFEDSKMSDGDSESQSDKKHNQGESNNEDDQADNEVQDGDDEDDEDEDEFDDDGSNSDTDKASGSSSDSSSSTTSTTTTTTTTERPIDRYLSHFDIAHEREEFKRAELAVEANYRDKITHVMHEWSQLDGRYERMKKENPQAAEEFKNKMTHQFQKTIEALEEEGGAQRHQLAAMHADRAMAIINRRKKAAMDCLTQALDRIPIKMNPVERCILRLLRALEKDRTHTLRQYKNLLNLNTREALKEKKIILDHLVTLNRAANQSIAMLDRSPVLVTKLKNKIVAFWHKLRNVPLNEPILKESELKTMEKYEEEVAQQRIEKERERLAEQEAIQDTPKESPSKPVKTTRDDDIHQQTTLRPEVPIRDKPVSGISGEHPQQDQITQSTTEHESEPKKVQQPPTRVSDEASVPQGDSSYRIGSARFAHLKADPMSHELSYSIKHEPIGGRLKFSYPTMLISACTIAVALALISMKFYGRNSSRAYRRQGFAEVGRSCPDERSVTKMQFNGYENPAYKFFEAEA